jgi:uncharacterized protein YutD
LQLQLQKIQIALFGLCNFSCKKYRLHFLGVATSVAKSTDCTFWALQLQLQKMQIALFGLCNFSCKKYRLQLKLQRQSVNFATEVAKPKD